MLNAEIYQDMKPLILALLLLLLPQTTAPAQTATSPKDVLGWQEARWGMTTEELQKQFGGKLSKRGKKDYAVKGEKRYAYADYEIKGLDLADDVFDVDFLMDIDTHKLIGIRVQTAEDKQYDSQARVIFEKVEKSLRAKVRDAWTRRKRTRANHPHPHAPMGLPYDYDRTATPDRLL